MKRRSFLVTTSLGASATLAGCGEGPGARRRGSAAITGERVHWRLASSFTRSLDTLFGTAERFTERVAELTGGNFQIDVYQGGELVPALEVLDAVGRRSVEMGHTASYYYIGKNPALAFDSAVPFGLTARQQNAWLYYGGGLELARELLADFNVINFPGGNTGVQMGGWFRREVGSLTDLAGLKMRIPGLGGEVMSRLGVTVQVLAGGDVYVALERGAIDAAEWVGPYDDQRLGLNEAARYYYYPGWWEPGANLSFYVNRTSWEKLPSAYQAAIEAATAEANVTMLSDYDARNTLAIRELKAGGTLLRPFPNDLMIAARRESQELLEEGAAGDRLYRKVYDSFRNWKESTSDWLGLAEQEYARYAIGDRRGADRSS